MTKYLVILILALSALQEPLPPEGYPGQRQHGPPPAGWFCSHNDPNPAKACACKRTDKSHDCDDPTSAPEDVTCAVYCHKSHCHCKLICDHPEHDGPEPGSEPAPEAPESEAAASGMHRH